MGKDPRSHAAGQRGVRIAIYACTVALLQAGCWAPLHSPGIPARSLGDEFRVPMRTAGPPLNFSSLTIAPQPDYILGPSDILEVTVHGIYPTAPVVPLRAQIMANGEIQLPLVGAVKVGGMNLAMAHAAIKKAFDPDYIRDARINVTLAERSTTSVLVLGEVTTPGVYRLPKYENDVAHALATAGGLREDAGLVVEVHRRVPVPATKPAEPVEPGAPRELPATPAPEGLEQVVGCPDEGMRIIHIPLRGFAPEPWGPQDVVLNSGDVVVVPSRKDEVFYVTGKLSPTNFVRFNIGARERDLGAGFVLPRDREVDVVTAVAMAGYIDPIDSPTTVTVHRVAADGEPMLIHVDLIAARFDWRETIYVQPGDIIYLNPDFAWWARRSFDRIIEPLFALPLRKLLGGFN
jgi:polysaccharide export outer membrane protein